MKKITLLGAMIVLLVSITCMDASAAETFDPYDSRNIPSEVMEMIDEEDTVVVLRIYNTPVSTSFYAYNSIEEIFEHIHTWDFYMHQTKDGKVVIHQIDHEGMYHSLPEDEVISYNPRALQEYKTQEALKAVSSDIVLESIYFIYGDIHDGSAVYYKTDIGDYVYYYDWLTERIFPADAFFAYKKAEGQQYIDSQKGTSTGSSYVDSWDLSVYDYRSPNFNPNAPFPKMDTPSPDTVPNTTVPASGSAEPAEDATDPLLLWGSIGVGAVLLTVIVILFITKRKKPEKA